MTKIGESKTFHQKRMQPDCSDDIFKQDHILNTTVCITCNTYARVFHILVILNNTKMINLENPAKKYHGSTMVLGMVLPWLTS